ncbi:hypothetical protein LDENG_00098240 [Lucifuga dentata]|nr:hypothetical protein LDENG_00098240 [Lucifuga dentata]
MCCKDLEIISSLGILLRYSEIDCLRLTQLPERNLFLVLGRRRFSDFRDIFSSYSVSVLWTLSITRCTCELAELFYLQN